MHGGAGVTQLTSLPEMWTYARFVRLADGPDAAHRHQVGRDALKTAPKVREQHAQYDKRYRELCQQWGIDYEEFL